MFNIANRPVHHFFTHVQSACSGFNVCRRQVPRVNREGTPSTIKEYANFLIGEARIKVCDPLCLNVKLISGDQIDTKQNEGGNQQILFRANLLQFLTTNLVNAKWLQKTIYGKPTIAAMSRAQAVPMIPSN